MIKRDEYINALFIYNDNIESKNSCTNGLGNAYVRQYNVPKSTGRGFKSLTVENKK